MATPSRSEPSLSWDVLARKWLATGLQDDDLFQQIRAAARSQHGSKSTDIFSLLDHLREDPVKRFADVPDFNFSLSTKEILTLRICLFFPGVMTAEIIQFAAPDDIPELAQVTQDTALDLLKISEPLDDLTLEGAIALLGCRGGRYLSDPKGAIALGKRAVRVYRSLCNEGKDDDHERSWIPHLATALQSLGLALYADGRKASAARLLKLALKIFETSHQAPQNNHDEEIAGVCFNLSNLYFETGQMARMVGLSGKALTVMQHLAANQPDLYLPKLGHVLDNLAAGLRHLKKPGEALVPIRNSLETWRSLSDHSPEIYGRFLAEARLQMSYCLREAGRPRAARLMAYRALQQQLRDDSPDETFTLSLTFDQHASCCALTDQIDGAIQSFKEAQNHLEESPLVLAQSQDRLSTLLSHAGRAEDALHYAKCTMDGYEELAQIDQSVDRTSDLAMAATNLAARLMTLGHLRSALQTARKSVGYYRKLAPDEASEDFDNAIKAYLNLSTYLSEAGHPKRGMPHIHRALAMLRKSPSGRTPLLAKLLTNLSLRYFEVGQYSESVTTSGEAIGLYRDLCETKPKTFQLSLASALNNYVLGSFQTDQHAQGIEALTEALQILDGLKSDQSKILEDVITIRRNEALRRMRGRTTEDYKAAHAMLRKALGDCDQLRSGFRSDAHRKRAQAYHQEIRIWQVGLCLGLAKLENDSTYLREAFEVSETARARSLFDLLSEVQVTQPGCNPKWIEEYHRLRRQLGELEKQTWPDDKLEVAKESRQNLLSTGTRLLPPFDEIKELTEVIYHKNAATLHQQLGQQVSQIQQQAPGWNPEQPIQPSSIDQIQQALPDHSVLLQFSLLKDRVIALALHPSDQNITQLEFPELTGQKIAKLQTDWNIKRAALKRGQISFREFASYIDHLVEELSVSFGGEFERFLQKIKNNTDRLVISPSGPLHQFPLHACRLSDQTVLGDAFEISYIPSGSILAAIKGRPSFTKPHRQLITNPTQDLIFADLEHQILKRRHEWQTSLTGQEATKQSTLPDLSAASYLLFSGHSHFADSSPAHSGLRFSDGTLSIQDLFERKRLGNCHLAFLNGCESGFMKPDRTDDFVSLTTAFLYSGAQTVISTLWPIHDLASCLFSAKFNELHLNQKLGIGEAFQHATKWLRGQSDDGLKNTASVISVLEQFAGTPIIDKLKNEKPKLLPDIEGTTPPFQSPAYWAAYMMSGVPWE